MVPETSGSELESSSVVVSFDQYFSLLISHGREAFFFHGLKLILVARIQKASEFCLNGKGKLIEIKTMLFQYEINNLLFTSERL